MTTDSVPNPFTGDEGVRIERAARRAIPHLSRYVVEDLVAALRVDPELSNEDFTHFFHTLLDPRQGWEVERWLHALIREG